MNKKYLYFISTVSMFALLLSLNVSAQEASSTETKAERVKSSKSEEHRNRVSDVVKELEKIADKDWRVGDEIKLVAQEEKEVSEKIKEKMEKVENRSALKTFFIGSDYKNLGALRSELVTTQNHIDRLNKALEKTTTSENEADLLAQIKNLSEIQTKVEDFIKSMEGKFSLFGWLAKRLNQ